MKNLMIAVLMVLVLTSPVLAQNYIYFNPSDDAYVDSTSPNTNFGGSTNLYLGDRTAAGGGSCYFFLQFDISDFVAANEILNAELWLYKHEKYGTPEQQCTVSLHHITTPGWDENAITFNAQPSYSATPTDQNTGFFNPTGWAYWNVTADVIVDRPGGLTGWCVKMTPQDPWWWLNFYSEEQVPLPDFRPVLEIMYSGPVATENQTLEGSKMLYR